MHRALVLLAAAVALAAVACSTPPVPETGISGMLPGESLPKGSGILILRVPDFVQQLDDDKELVASNSGALVGASLRQTLEAKGYVPVVSKRVDREGGFIDAPGLSCDYVLESAIVGWRDTAKGWREAPDRIELRLRLYRVQDEALVAYAREEFEGNEPDDFVETPHRLLSDLVKRALDPIVDGWFLDEIPDDAHPEPEADPEES